MTRFRLRSTHALVLVCAGLYVGAAAQVRGPRGTALNVGLSGVVTPVLEAVNLVGAAWDDLRSGERDLHEAIDAADRLRLENADLKRSNQLLMADLAALRQGSKLLADFPSFSDGAVLARVVAREVLATHTLRLDKGSRDGVRTDSAVIADGGVLGRVDRVFDHACRVQLLSHPAAAAAAKVVGVDAEALLLGGDRASLTGIPPYTEIKPGTAVVTTGSEGIYPPGLLLGTTGEARTAGLFTAVDVTLAVRPADVVMALVLRPRGGGR